MKKRTALVAAVGVLALLGGTATTAVAADQEPAKVKDHPHKKPKKDKTDPPAISPAAIPRLGL